MQFRWRKWDGSPHWVHDCVYLGHDEWGDWFGQRAGWRSTRPERDFLVEADSVTLMPPSGQYALTVNVAPPATYRIYIDLGWDLRWDETDGLLEPTGIDMDLDVVSAVDGRGIWIDDRDEWDEHRVAYGYPLDDRRAARVARRRSRGARPRRRGSLRRRDARCLARTPRRHGTARA